MHGRPRRSFTQLLLGLAAVGGILWIVYQIGGLV